MADQEAGAKKTGWFKACLGTIAGLCSGAAVMYVTPFVDKAIKPAKPLANFDVKHDGLNVRIQNLSNVRQGYWDYGDGTPLEPVTDADYVNHPYLESGSYTIKLTLQNVLNEENDRSVVVKLDGVAVSTTPQKPQITKFEVAPACSNPNNMAPASFRLVGEVQNAKHCVWSLGDGRITPVQDPSAGSDEMVTFDKAGVYTVKLMAMNGKTLRDEKSITVTVTNPPPGVAKAVVSVTDAGKRLETRANTSNVHVVFPQHQNQKENSFKFDNLAGASMPGYSIADVRIYMPDKKVIRLGGNTEMVLDAIALGQKAARNLRLTLAPDRKSVKLSGELVRSNLTAPPSFMLPVELIEQREIDDGPSEQCLTRALGMPGSTFPSSETVTLPKLPDGGNPANRQIRIELDDGPIIVVPPSQLPVNYLVMVQSRRCIFTATRVNDQVQVTLTESTALRAPGSGQ